MKAEQAILPAEQALTDAKQGLTKINSLLGSLKKLRAQMRGASVTEFKRPSLRTSQVSNVSVAPPPSQ